MRFIINVLKTFTSYSDTLWSTQERYKTSLRENTQRYGVFHPVLECQKTQWDFKLKGSLYVTFLFLCFSRCFLFIVEILTDRHPPDIGSICNYLTKTILVEAIRDVSVRLSRIELAHLTLNIGQNMTTNKYLWSIMALPCNQWTVETPRRSEMSVKLFLL